MAESDGTAVVDNSEDVEVDVLKTGSEEDRNVYRKPLNKPKEGIKNRPGFAKIKNE